MEKITRREFVQKGLLMLAGLLVLPLAGPRPGPRGGIRPVRARWGRKLAG